jgi:hypothetical protein
MGLYLSRETDGRPVLIRWEHDWRRGGLTERKAELNDWFGLYQQPTLCDAVGTIDVFT